MSQVISIFRAAMARREQHAVNPHRSEMAPSSAFERLMRRDPPPFDSTPCGIEFLAPVDVDGPAPQLPEEC